MTDCPGCPLTSLPHRHDGPVVRFTGVDALTREANMRAMADHVAQATADALAQVPPGYRLVSTSLHTDTERNMVTLVSDWEPEPCPRCGEHHGPAGCPLDGHR